MEFAITNAQRARKIRRGTISTSSVNINAVERWLSALGGGALVLAGLRRGSVTGALLATAGGALVVRGLTGYSRLYQALRIGTNVQGRSPAAAVRLDRGIKIDRSIIVRRSPEELYAFWRDFERLPQVMTHLESVTATRGRHSHWVARGPAGVRLEWDAVIFNERPDELIAWRSLEGADVDMAGTVLFERLADGGGTRVRVSLKYDPPGGVLGATLARWLGSDPVRVIEEDLERFRELMESGAQAPAPPDLSSHGHPNR